MPTSATEAAVPDGARLLVAIDETGALGRWLLVGDGFIAARGEAASGLPEYLRWLADETRRQD